jgi:hypothetical protein
MKLCYICGPYRHKEPVKINNNIAFARMYAEKYWRLGYAVLCPHMNSAHLDGVVADQQFLRAYTDVFVPLCDLLVVIPGFEKSIGSKLEIKRAKELKIEIIYEKPLS